MAQPITDDCKYERASAQNKVRCGQKISETEEQEGEHRQDVSSRNQREGEVVEEVTPPCRGEEEDVGPTQDGQSQEAPDRTIAAKTRSPLSLYSTATGKC